MPVVTLQVGQCGNQLGQALWQALDRQCPPLGSLDLQEAAQFFRLDPTGRRQARCLLVDTEPKVVNGVLQQDSHGFFSKRRCYLGQSGRGNNWAFGYHQVLQQGQGPGAAVARGPVARGSGAPTAPWNNSALVEDPNQEEHHILEHVVEGIRQECEECDGAADFLLLHSLGGGSGSGMGSRILEHLRDQYPLHHVAAVSVAARTQGDSPMQSLNSVLALSFLQAYADVVLLFNNQEMIDAAAKGLAAGPGRGGGGTGAGVGATLLDVNAHIATCVAGALWPLEPHEPLGGASRIRDLVATVASDVCCKLTDARTASGLPAGCAWPDACRKTAAQQVTFDALDGGRPVTTAGALLLARGFDAQQQLDLAAWVAASGGRASFAGSEMPNCSDVVAVRSGTCTLAVGASNSGRGSQPQQPQGQGRGGRTTGAPSLTCVSNRSNIVGLVSSTVDRATSIWQAGAYLHWYEKYGCGRDAVRTAIEQVADVVDCYRAVHGIDSPD